jgi:fused signal recognition particle receptor
MPRLSFAENLKNLFGLHKTADASFFEELADSLIEGDLGAKMAFEIVGQLERQCKKNAVFDIGEIRAELAALLSPFAREISLVPEPPKVSIYMVLGVNGVGKTTSVAKMGAWYQTRSQAPVILAACDTFRAAAIEQLKYHGEKTGLRVVAHQSGSDPGAVVFDAADAVRSLGGGLVLADTAGRLHNKENLVRELQKIDRIAAQKADPGCYRKILVLDATTGQNGMRQAEVFHESVGVDAIILTKFDSTARGGIALSCGKELGLPVAFVGTGERYADFSPFDSASYLREFTGSARI